jgi:hypothetical protein
MVDKGIAVSWNIKLYEVQISWSIKFHQNTVMPIVTKLPMGRIE